MINLCNQIFEQYEVKNLQLNNEIFSIVLEEFLKEVDLEFLFASDMSAAEKVIGLKEQYIYSSKCEYRSLFFSILEKYHYNMKEEIKEAMFHLGTLQNFEKNSQLIRKLLGSPVLQDISFNGKDEFTIFSQQYGKFKFKLASSYFKKAELLVQYIKSSELARNCHHHTYFMTTVFPNFYSITSLCQAYFIGSYYHSYSYDQDNELIIDLCSNSVIAKESYDALFAPEVISKILNRDVPVELVKASSFTKQPIDRNELLKIALYKQYLSLYKEQVDTEASNYQKFLRKNKPLS